MLSNVKIPFKALPTLLPHKVRRKWRATKSRIRSRQTPTSSIASLQSSFSPTDTLRSLRTHHWSHYDAQYLLLAIVGIFCLSVIQEPGPIFKTFVATLLMSSLVLPVTRQFFLNFLPIAAYLLLFYSCKFIPADYRPPIWVRVLPTLENILYGANLSNILSAHKHVILDILAWIPYGVGHFAAPFICAIALFIWGPPGTLPVYARAFGYMSLLGVATNLVFPCSPPWYENHYGLAPANYSIPGEAAGLARIDKLFGIDLYVPGFASSPSPFGAFPSLHAADSTLEALFLGHVFPKLLPVFLGYVLWLWWATMYLSHHYAVDLVAGSLLAAFFFFFARQKFLPRVQPDKEFRWDYDYTEIGEPEDAYTQGMLDFYEEFHPTGNSDSDEWTIGSSSSFSSGARSPSNGPPSPADEHNYTWESDTLASHSDHEQSH
ncbi:aureobasidin resistance protein Aur1 [Pseudovirgaria hyperparasitica]|uniref:Aureobasidin resistance protein Aur1 n=1 Tax=Pseudovirgaria hyperparasitica TaxID=470096 RepID=A0A6A6WDR6_9PEZI|nr:aureobasidin resistance protein Aur1 [Pseudovirgaria hyperparasitica]KAF2760120.1 aureobasidin resistance protein Aur1 [Pseudovirgaria hyperparasitica]